MDLIVQLQLYNSINSLILVSLCWHKTREGQGSLPQSSGSNHVPVDIADLKKKNKKRKLVCRKKLDEGWCLSCVVLQIMSPLDLPFA